MPRTWRFIHPGLEEQNLQQASGPDSKSWTCSDSEQASLDVIEEINYFKTSAYGPSETSETGPVPTAIST